MQILQPGRATIGELAMDTKDKSEYSLLIDSWNAETPR